MKSRMAGFERDTITAVWNSKRVWLIHLIANALLFTAFFYWLRIDDDSGLHIVMTVVLGAILVLSTLSLHGATLDYFRHAHREASPRFLQAVRETLARVPAFLIWTLIFGYALYAIGGAWDYDAQVGGYTRHLLPGVMRSHIGPRSMTSAFVTLVGIVFYILWPIIFLPIGSQLASFNFRGFTGHRLLAALRPVRSLRFWVMYVLCFAIGMYVPYRLAFVEPQEHASLHSQTVSMMARLGIGYVLLVTAWMVVCSAIGRAMEPEAETEIVDTIPQQVKPIAT